MRGSPGVVVGVVLLISGADDGWFGISGLFGDSGGCVSDWLAYWYSATIQFVLASSSCVVVGSTVVVVDGSSSL